MAVQTSYRTAPLTAFAGMLASDSPNMIRTMINAEASASIAFGQPVAFKTSSPSSENDVLLPAASGDKLCGVVVHSHDYERTFTVGSATVGELDSTGVVAGAAMAVLTQGEIWVTVKNAVVPGDSVHVSYASGGGTYTAAGQWGNAANGGSTIAVTNAQYLTASAANGLAKVRLGAKFA